MSLSVDCTEVDSISERLHVCFCSVPNTPNVLRSSDHSEDVSREALPGPAAKVHSKRQRQGSAACVMPTVEMDINAGRPSRWALGKHLSFVDDSLWV